MNWRALSSILTVVVGLFLSALPALATNHQPSKLEQRAGEEAAGFVITFMEVLLAPVVLLLTAVALLVFIYGATMYVINAENEQSREEGRRHMIFGVIGLFIMLSAYSIFWIFVNTLDLGDEFEVIESFTEQ